MSFFSNLSTLFSAEDEAKRKAKNSFPRVQQSQVKAPAKQFNNKPVKQAKPSPAMQAEASSIVEKARQEAQGIADSSIIKAKGEAEANQLLQASLTDTLVKYQTVLKWNGQYPQVVGGNQIISLPMAEEAKK